MNSNQVIPANLNTQSRSPISTYSDELIGRYCIVTVDRADGADAVRKNDIVKLMQKVEGNGEEAYGIAGVVTKKKYTEAIYGTGYSYYTSRKNLQLIEFKSKETKLMSKARIKVSERIAGLDSKLIGQRVVVAQKGTFNDLDFLGDEEGVIVNLSTDNYASEGGSFSIKFDNNAYGTAYVSPKYLKLSTEAIKALAGAPKKRLTKKERELAALPVLDASKEYVRIVASQLGIDITTIPNDVYLEMVTISDKTDINQILMTWNAKPKPKQVISDATKTLLTGLVTRQQRDFIARINSNINSYRNNAINYFTEANNSLRLLTEENRKLNVAQGKLDEKGMLAAVEEITKSGWWTFEEKRSKITTGADCELVFSTKDINIRHNRPDMGVNVNVDLGQFYVKYQVYNNNILVDCKDGNTISGSCSHPHIGSEINAQICWGNASTTYSQAMESGNPVKAFETLQSLIQNYGESPFTNLDGFVRIQAELKKTYTDTTGADYRLYESGNTVYRMKNYVVPKHFRDSPDIIDRNETTGLTKMRFWTKPLDSGLYIRSKENSNILYNFKELVNTGAGGTTITLAR